MTAEPASRWPLWTVPAGLVAGLLAGQLAFVLAAVPLAVTGASDGDVDGLVLLAGSLGFGAALLGVIALMVRTTEPLSAEGLALRPTAVAPAVAWTALLAVLMGALVFAWTQIADPGAVLGLPDELDGRTALEDGLDLGQSRVHAAVGFDAMASAGARVVVAGMVAEVVLRGFALPVLARWRGETVALGITAVLGIAPLAFGAGVTQGGEGVVLVALIAGVALGLLRLLTASVIPGIVLSSALCATGLGTAFGWSAPGVAALVTACSVVSVALAAAARGTARMTGPRRVRGTC